MGNKISTDQVSLTIGPCSRKEREGSPLWLLFAVGVLNVCKKNKKRAWSSSLVA